MKICNVRDAQKGQGLVEYALILVLVAVVVIAILLTLGPVVGEVFSKVTRVLGGPAPGVLTSISAARTGGGNGNDVVVTITVAKNTSVTATDLVERAVKKHIVQQQLFGNADRRRPQCRDRHGFGGGRGNHDHGICG